MLGTLVLLAGLATGLAWWTSTPDTPRETTSDTREDGPSASLRDASVVLPPLLPEADPPAPAEPPASAGLGAVDACSSGDDDPPVARPSTTELLQLRLAELNDRMLARQRSPNASAELRAGWEAVQDPARVDEGLRLLARAPDRLDAGFDTYVAMLVVVAANALHEGRASRAAALAEQASRAAPEDALPLVVGAVAEQAQGQHLASRALLIRAFALEPEEPAIAYSLAWRLADGADVQAALTAFDAYLEAVPGDRAMARQRARLQIRAASFAEALTYVRGGVRLVATPALPRERAMHVLDVVDAGLVRGAQILGVAPREELAVFVHADRDAMRRATCVQGWAGAVFDGALELDEVTVATDAGDPSITHECFHAAVHPAVPNVPTWLDEGLAQYVSGEEGPAHLRSYELMIRERTWIPFASMNDAFLVIDDSSDAGLAYHQALLMVDWLVERRGERGIADAAHWLIGGGDGSRVLAEAARAELDGEALLEFTGRHVAALRARGHAPEP